MNADRKLIFLMLLTVFSLSAASQESSRLVKINFELDGKPGVASKHIDFYGEGAQLVARKEIRNGTFESPILKPSDKVDVSLQFAGRTLTFNQVYGTKFEGTWIVGIDLPPFSDEFSWLVPEGSRPKELWFIRFNPLVGDGTAATVFVR